jgi:alpha-glucosidase
VAVKPEPQPDPNVYGTFKPYVQPKPVPKPKPANAPVDPNSLPGFADGVVAGPENATPEKVNVAVEDADPNSLLNFYRHLAQLHHDNASIRSGATEVLNHDAENALVWIRRPPAGSTTAGNVIVTCNLNDKPLTLSLDKDLERLHIHPGTLRPLAGSWTATPISQYSNHIVLPPYSVFIGEIKN